MTLRRVETAEKKRPFSWARLFFCRQLERAMPKRLDEARVLAAVAADDPPASADYRDDDEWHAAQDMWLVKWSGSVLPDGPQRRRKWDDRVKEHARLVAAAARAVASPASMPRRKGARKPPVPKAQELMLAAREEPMQLAADMPERASPARPPEDSEDLSLPPLAAVSIEPRQHAATPAAASMFSLPSLPPQPPARRTATERAAAERVAKRARRAEQNRRMFEEYQRAQDLEDFRGSAAWRLICDPSDDEGMMPVPEACGAVWEEEGEAEDEAAEDEAAEMAAKRVRRAERERRSANSSATHSIAASPFHAIQSRSIWDGFQSRSIWDGRMSGGRMRWAHDSNRLVPMLVPDVPTETSTGTSSGGWLSGNTLSRIKYGNSS